MRIAMESVSDIRDIDSSFLPEEDAGFRDYLRERHERTMQYLEKAAVGVGRAFVDRSRRLFEAANNSKALRRAREAIRSFAGMRRNSIFYADDLPKLQTANYRMQRYLAAFPLYREKAQRQLADCFSETYYDAHPGDIGVDHYDYRRVMDGMFRTEKGSDGEDLIIREVYYEQLIEGDRDLDHSEQQDILDSWDVMQRLMLAGIDPCCRRGGSIG